MKRFFLLQYENNIYTAEVIDNDIKYIHQTIFPLNCVYYFSKNGRCACLDIKNNVIISGIVSKEGVVNCYEIVNIPQDINPHSICIANEFILLGAKNDLFSKETKNNLLISININSKEVISIIEASKIDRDRIFEFKEYENKLFALRANSGMQILEFEFDVNKGIVLSSTYELSDCAGFSVMNAKFSINKEYFAIYNNLLNHHGDIADEIKIHQRNSPEYHLTYYQSDNIFSKKKETVIPWNGVIMEPYCFIIPSGWKGLGVVSLIGNYHFSKSDSSCAPLKDIIYIELVPDIIHDLFEVPESNGYIAKLSDENKNLHYKFLSKRWLMYEFHKVESERDPFRNESNYDWKRDYFNAMTDGQLGNYSDDIDLDSIDDWAGR